MKNDKYNITFETQPSKVIKDDETYKELLNKSISLIVDELLLVGEIKIG